MRTWRVGTARGLAGGPWHPQIAEVIPSGRAAEVFLSGAKDGSWMAAILDDASVVISIAISTASGRAPWPKHRPPAAG
jgi:hypothetical protein